MGKQSDIISGSALSGKERDALRINPFDVKKAEYVNYQDLYAKDKVQNIEIGFSLGGYIIKDRGGSLDRSIPKFWIQQEKSNG